MRHLLSDRLAELHPRRFFLETWAAMDEAARGARAERAAKGRGYDFSPLVTFCAGALFLTLMEYWGNWRAFDEVIDRLGAWGYLVPDLVRDRGANPFWELEQHAWWAGWRVLGYFVLPAVVVRLRGEQVRDQGLATDGFREHAWIYGLCYAVVVVCVVTVSFEPQFQRYYPFYHQSHRSWLDFAVWELLYAAQFFSLEFFFRGWWLESTRNALGSHAIFAMVVPYVMIHFGKPFPEVLGAIVAGIVLGTLAMRTRSIWSGFLIHVSVAITMDVAALVQTTGLPRVIWPELP